MPQTEEQKKNALQASGLTPTQQSNVSAGIASKPIDISAITSTPSLNIPTYAPPPAPTIAPPPAAVIQNTPTQNALDIERQGINDTINADITALGTKSARQKEIEAQQGVPQINTDLQELYNLDANYEAQLSNLNSKELQSNIKSEDRFAPTFAISGEQAQAARQKTFLAAGINIQRATNAAVISSKQGQLALAQKYIQDALATEFDPKLAEIEAKKNQLAQNMDKFNTEEKRAAEQRQVQYDKEKTAALNERADKQSVYDVMKIAASFGAPTGVISKILSATDYGTAISAAGEYLQDPKAQYQLEAARLDNILTRAQITKTQKETSQIGQPTPTERDAAAKATAAAQAAIPSAKDKLTLIDSLINSPGLAGTVGPNVFARSSPDFNAFTGVRQNFIAGVNQLTNQETLDTLLSLKQQGGSLGALSDSEGALLRQASSKIGTWAIRDKSGNVTGYNTTEAAMKAELTTMKTLANRALDKAASNLVTKDEKSAISALLATPNTQTSIANFDPSLYFQK